MPNHAHRPTAAVRCGACLKNNGPLCGVCNVCGRCRDNPNLSGHMAAMEAQAAEAQAKRAKTLAQAQTAAIAEAERVIAAARAKG